MIERARKNPKILDEWYRLFELMFAVVGPCEIAEIAESISPYRITHFVDVGCGAGDFTCAIQKRCGFHVDALEPEHYYYEKTLKKFPNKNIKFLNMPLSSYTTTADCLFFRYVAQHFADKTGLCKDAAGKLCAGGIAVVVESIACQSNPQIESYKTIGRRFLDFYTRGTPKELENDIVKSFINAGFRLERQKILHIPIVSAAAKSAFGEMIYNAGLVKAMSSEQDLTIMEQMREELQILQTFGATVDCRDILLVFQKL